MAAMQRALVIALALAGLPGAARAWNPKMPLPPIPCQVFPADSVWNRDVSALPLHPQSAAYVNSIGASSPLHPDFGSKKIGIPYAVVPATQPAVPITFNAYGDESDPGPYPVSPKAPVERGSDRHVLVVQTGPTPSDSCKLYELFAARRRHGGAFWTAASGASWDLGSNTLRHDTWTSADAAGLPILPGLVRYDEVQSGAIHHALRFTVPNSQQAYVWPARHLASSNPDPNLPPMGVRFRLKAAVDISSFSPINQIILTALKTYGMFVADNGTNWYFQGEGGKASSCWNDSDLDQLKNVPGSAFEVVKTGRILRKSAP
jgi:hypothetical protein